MGSPAMADHRRAQCHDRLHGIRHQRALAPAIALAPETGVRGRCPTAFNSFHYVRVAVADAASPRVRP